MAVNNGDEGDGDVCVGVPGAADWTFVEVAEGATVIVAVLPPIVNNTAAELLGPQPLSPKKSTNCDAADDWNELELAVAALRIENAGVTTTEEPDHVLHVVSPPSVCISRNALATAKRVVVVSLLKSFRKLRTAG